MGGRGRRSDWVLWSPRNVPLPNELHPPVRLEYAGMLRDLCKNLEATVNVLKFEPLSVTPTDVRHTLLHRLVRLHGMLAVIAEIYAARFEVDGEVRATRLRLERVAARAEAMLETPEDSGTHRVPSAPDLARARTHLRQARHEAEKASELALVAVDHERFDLPHVVMLRSRVRRTIENVVDALRRAAFGREGDAVAGLLDQADGVAA